VGLIVDANVFIHHERRGAPADLSRWDPTEDIFVSAITISELLMGVFRADSEERRKRRSEFVEAIIGAAGILDFTVAVARRHAQVYAELAQHGQLIGAHDMIIAATALHHRLPLLTSNVDEFSRVDGLQVIPFDV
jgi:tRNA(fMet)-specific endonuclease VapC